MTGERNVDKRATAAAGRSHPLRRGFLRGGAVVLGLTALFVATLTLPQACFSSMRDGASIRVRSDAPIPESAAHVISLAESRIEQSTLFDATQTYPVYFCNDRWRWNYFSGFEGRSRGFQTPLGRAVFLRPARWDENQLTGPDGSDGPRTLDTYIAHEVTHTMVADHIGIVAARRLPAWLAEGYAEYVSRHDAFDYEATRVRFLVGDDGLGARDRYARYLLLVTHLIDREGRDVRDLLESPPDPHAVEARVRAGSARNP